MYSNNSIKKLIKNRVWCWYFEGSLGLQVIDVKDLKFTACQLMYIHLLKQVFEGLVTYSKVKRINRGCVTHYTTKLTLEIRTIVI